MRTEPLIRTLVQAYETGDVDLVGSLLDEKLHYRIHSSEAFGAYRANCNCLDDFWEAVKKIQADWSIDEYKLVDLITTETRAAAQIKVTATSRHTHETYETELALFFTVSDGKVSELHEYHDTALIGRSRG